MDDLFFIPTGDYLRQFIGNPMVKASDIKALLKKRGSHSSSSDKKILGPILIKTGISPCEFEELKECIQAKEENPKIQTRKMEWCSSSTLIDALPYDFDFSKIVDDPFGIVSLSNSPMFTSAGDGKNPNHIIAEIVIKREDKTKNFGVDSNEYKCSVELEIDEGNIDLNLTFTHSSKETLDVINKLSKIIEKHFLDKNYTKKIDVKRLLFSDFDNESRMDFFINLAKFNESYFYYNDTKKVHITPDNTISGRLPAELEWAEQKVKDLMFKGNDLDSSIFLVVPKVKKYLRLHSISCNFDFKYKGSEGTCLIKFYFPDSENDAISELFVEVERMNLKIKLSNKNKSQIKTDILRILDKKKIEFYDKFRKI